MVAASPINIKYRISNPSLTVTHALVGKDIIFGSTVSSPALIRSRKRTQFIDYPPYNYAIFIPQTRFGGASLILTVNGDLLTINGLNLVLGY